MLLIDSKEDIYNEKGDSFTNKLNNDNLYSNSCAGNRNSRITKKRKNKNLYKKVKNIKKLKVAELKDLLDKALEKENYIQLEFSQPEIAKYVIISFTSQDKKSKREEYDSKTELRRLINKTLSNTNWRLMSEGVDYRLGVLSGRFKGLELEDDLVNLVKNKNG